MLGEISNLLAATINSMEKTKIYFNRAQALLAESRLRLADHEIGEYLVLPEGVCKADLEPVQCFLLVSQYRQSTQRFDETWSLHGLAIHAATQIGLHCAHATRGMESSDTEMRKRTWFARVLLGR